MAGAYVDSFNKRLMQGMQGEKTPSEAEPVDAASTHKLGPPARRWAATRIQQARAGA